MMLKADKQKSYKIGLFAETLALWYLRLKGYRLLARRAKTPVGEIDLIMRRGKLVVAVEVKRRKSLESAIYSITTNQQRRIANALQYWGQSNQKFDLHDKRFDIVLVSENYVIRHLKNAWMLNL